MRIIKYNCLVVITVLACATAGANAAIAASGPPADPLGLAVKALSLQENAVHNIRFESSFHGWSIKNGKKHPGTKVDSASIYDGLPRGKFRIRVLRQVTPWTNGAGPYYLSAYIVAYNGQAGTFLQTITGTPKNRSLMDDGKIAGKSPYRVVGYLDYDTGWAESIFGFTAPLRFEQPRFSVFLTPGQKFTTIRARWVQRKGEKLLRVSRVGPPFGRDVFLLDPRHGYAIVRREFYGFATSKSPAGKVLLTPGKLLRSRFRVSGFFEPAPGIFFPKRIVMHDFELRPGGTTIASGVASINISNVSVNLPGVDDKTFTVAFPRGASVVDESTGKRVEIGGTPRQQAKEIKDAIAAARKALSNSSTTKN